MKSSEEMLKSLYERRDKYLEAQKKKRKTMIKIAGAGTALTAACVAGIFIWHNNQPTVTQTKPATESTEIISVAENKTENDNPAKNNETEKMPDNKQPEDTAWVKGNIVILGESGADGFFDIKENVCGDDSIYELLQNPKDDNEKYYVSISVDLDDYELFVYEGKTYNEYFNDPALKAYWDEYEEWYETEYKELEKQKLKELSDYEMAVWEKNNTPENLFPEVWKGRHSAEEIEEYNKALESERKAFSEYCHWLDSDAYRQALEKKAREIFTELVKYGIENHFLETLQGDTAKGNLTVKQMLDFPIENIKDCKIRIRAISE